MTKTKIKRLYNKHSFMMKKALLLSAFAFVSLSYMAQDFTFKVNGVKDTTVFLIRYFGKNLYYADTAEMKNGVVRFDGSKQKPGILGVLFPEQKFFEFVYNNEDVNLETDASNFVESMKVKKSVENKLFVGYVQYIGQRKQRAGQLTQQRDALDKESDEYKKLTEEIQSISDDVKNYQLKLIADNPSTLTSKIVKMSMDVEVPEAPKDENGNITDSNFRYNYYRTHFFDNIDLKDDRLVNTPIFHSKLSTYFGKTMMIQHWDTIVKYAYDFCDRLEPKSEMFKYSVTYIISNFSKSKVMGMDKVYVMMADRYICRKGDDGEYLAFWMEEDKIKEVCEKIPAQKNTMLGIKPPNISLRDTTDKNWKDFYSLDAEYTILYFWDPECGHCKKTTPKLETLYREKFRDRNIEIFAVGKAVGEDFEKWKKFIREKELTFINVAVTESLYRGALEDARQFVPKYTTLEALNYQTTFDIFSTPRVFVLDKDKKIIAKQISISQLEDMMDRLQGKKDLPKLFPPDPEEDEQMQQ